MPQLKSSICPFCKSEAQFHFIRQRNALVCNNCDEGFAEAPAPLIKRGGVFLSYGHDPACEEILRRIENDLAALGWKPWIDKKRTEFGNVWRSEITRGLQESDHVLGFLSDHSTRKTGVFRQGVAYEKPTNFQEQRTLVKKLSDL